MINFDAVSYFISPLVTRSLGLEDVRHLRASVVTQLCLDHGMIDDAIYFTSDEVLGGAPLKEGDLVNCTAVRDRAQGGWKALRVTTDISFRSVVLLVFFWIVLDHFLRFCHWQLLKRLMRTLRSSAMKARKQTTMMSTVQHAACHPVRRWRRVLMLGRKEGAPHWKLTA